MSIDSDTIATTASRIGIAGRRSRSRRSGGERRSPTSPVIIFSTKAHRDEWLGIVLEGEVEIVRGAQARSTTLATLAAGAALSAKV